MRRSLLGLLVAALAFGACKKKTAPEYYEYEATHSILLSREGDEAYGSEELAAVVRGLQAVSPDTVEGPKAKALLERIAAEARRVEAERRAEVAALEAEARAEGGEGSSGGFEGGGEGAAPAQADGGTADGGLPGPTLGMSEQDFVQAFGSCFAAGPELPVPDAGVASSQRLLADAACQKRFGQPGVESLYYFLGTRLAGVRTRAPDTVTYVDAGVPPPRPQPPHDPAPMQLMPGMPMPEGYVPQPGSPGSEAPAGQAPVEGR